MWQGSHHDLAMQPATPDTVLGNFNDASFTYHQITSTFLRRDGKFLVRTDGPDGQLHDYEIAFAFGVYPLQQYLIAFPDGRMQALNVCWDTRPKDDGGQRWFHLYPDEHVTHEDILHWTGAYQNWNHMCAECHSTSVHKGYDAAADRFRTTYAEIDVSCEACHGPGSAHVAWAQSHPAGSPRDANDDMGLVVRLKEPQTATWLFDPQTGIAKRDVQRTSHTEIETCARCHSRRGTFSEEYVHGRPLADTHRLALLDPTLYEFDGQIKDEVYEYTSFVQSRMYAAGVTCSDCHNPHSLKTIDGNATCARCHQSDRFDTPEHHFHAAGAPGSNCVDCHASTRNYMVIHARHDHSFRVPRPDLTLKIGTPNACNQCHAERTAQWAAEAALRWWGPRRPSEFHYGQALAAGQLRWPGYEAAVSALVADAAQPAIVRATAAALLADRGDRAATAALASALHDGEAIVRAAVVSALRDDDPATRATLLSPLLGDPVRSVRIDAARALADVPDGLLSRPQQEARRAGLAEFRAAQLVDADRAEARLNLGALHLARGETAQAEAEYRAAIRLGPRFPAAYVNLADLYRATGREAECERALRDGLGMAAGSADLEHALGLALVRQRRLDEALPRLQRAAQLAPGVPRYAYVYAVGLYTAGDAGAALVVLRVVHERHPGDADVLASLAIYSAESGSFADAIVYAERLVALRPTDVGTAQLLEQIRSMAAPPPAASGR
jgi:Flp pilus assembly protein TadD